MNAGDAEFTAFATAAAPRLRRTAYLLCQDWHLAQDLTQTTLAKSYVSWKRVAASGNPEAYSQRMLFRVFLDHRRRRSGSELVLAEPPEPAGGPSDPSESDQSDLRITLFEALGRLPARDRAIVVLRYWEDQSIETTAETLRLPVATVKKQALRSLAKLRNLLHDDQFALFAGQD